jgi:hypothetical protein
MRRKILTLPGVMKFTTALGVAVLVSVVAVDAKHSAERFARGLPPFPPAHRERLLLVSFTSLLLLLFIPTDMMYVAMRKEAQKAVCRSTATFRIWSICREHQHITLLG